MLILSRKRGEEIRIGDISVMVVAIKGESVRLGVSAPANVPVHREEIYQLIRRAENEASS